MDPGSREHPILLPRSRERPGARFLESVDADPTPASVHPEEVTMEVVHERCAGLDVHQHSVVACVRIAASGTVAQEVRTFETTTQGCSRWGLAHGAGVYAAMESRAVYWKPVWQVLESCAR